MDRKSMQVVAVAMLSALCACAGAGREAKPERSSDSMGSEPGFQLLMVDAGGVHRFGNADARPGRRGAR